MSKEKPKYITTFLDGTEATPEEWERRFYIDNSILLKFWFLNNYHLTAIDAKEFINVQNLELEVIVLRKIGIPINQEIRRDLGETEKRYWLDEKYREANR